MAVDTPASYPKTSIKVSAEALDLLTVPTVLFITHLLGFSPLSVLVRVSGWVRVGLGWLGVGLGV